VLPARALNRPLKTVLARADPPAGRGPVPRQDPWPRTDGSRPVQGDAEHQAHQRPNCILSVNDGTGPGRPHPKRSGTHGSYLVEAEPRSSGHGRVTSFLAPKAPTDGHGCGAGGCKREGAAVLLARLGVRPGPGRRAGAGEPIAGAAADAHAAAAVRWRHVGAVAAKGWGRCGRRRWLAAWRLGTDVAGAVEPVDGQSRLGGGIDRFHTVFGQAVLG
jgi:hypothetical protein